MSGGAHHDVPGPAVGGRGPRSLDARVLGERDGRYDAAAKPREEVVHLLEQHVQVRRACPQVASAMQGAPDFPGHPVQHGGWDRADGHEAGVGPRQLQDRQSAVLDPTRERGRTLARRRAVAHDRPGEGQACPRRSVVALDLGEFAVRLENRRSVALRPARRSEQRRERGSGAADHAQARLPGTRALHEHVEARVVGKRPRLVLGQPSVQQLAGEMLHRSFDRFRPAKRLGALREGGGPDDQVQEETSGGRERKRADQRLWQARRAPPSCPWQRRGRDGA